MILMISTSARHLDVAAARKMVRQADKEKAKLKASAIKSAQQELVQIQQNLDGDLAKIDDRIHALEGKRQAAADRAEVKIARVKKRLDKLGAPYKSNQDGEA